MNYADNPMSKCPYINSIKCSRANMFDYCYHFCDSYTMYKLKHLNILDVLIGEEVKVVTKDNEIFVAIFLNNYDDGIRIGTVKHCEIINGEKIETEAYETARFIDFECITAISLA